MYLLFILFTVLMFDQSSKYFISNSFHQGQSLPVITNIFHITYVQNPGAAFGMLAYRTNFFIVVTVLVIAIILIVYRQVPVERKLLRAGLGLQLAGAMGNFIDRLRLGYVVDFFDFRVWPVFNIADMAIVVGVCLLAVEILRTSEKGKEA